MNKRPIPLDPHGRCTLRDVLAPPSGYRLERALGTAYSLDAETLVSIPLFAAGIGAEELRRSVGISRIYELGTRLTLLVQGDRIAISKRWAGSRPLLRLLGDAVVPCSIKDASFHPKLLVLEFASLDQPGKTLTRVVIATRNLTTDNAWDSVVVLDESAKGVHVPGLSETIAGLADFVNDPSHPSISLCRKLSVKLRSVRFHPLPGVTDLEIRLFHRGSTTAADVFQKIRGDDLLVISPFLRKRIIDDLAAQAGIDKGHRWLVTRPVDVPATAFTNYQVFQISHAAMPAHRIFDEDYQDEPLSGLHAKIYLASSRKGGTRLVVTSANATLSGWQRNVEVAVTGVIKAPAFNVPALLSQPDNEKELTFRNLLEGITPAAVAASTREADWIIKARRILAGAVVLGQLKKGPPRIMTARVLLRSEDKEWPKDIEICICPYGYENLLISLAPDGHNLIGSIGIDPGVELTPFAMATLQHKDEQPVEIVLAMQLQGDLDWDREAARAVLAQAARPELYRELLWYFGVRGGDGEQKRTKNADTRDTHRERHLAILERILLRVNSANAQTEVMTIDSLLSGLTDDVEDQRLASMWKLVKDSLK